MASSLPPCPPAPPPARSAGFTLVEMLVVLAILGVLASVSVAALPSLTRVERPTIASHLSEARRAAVVSARDVAVAIPDHATGRLRTWRFWPDGRAAGPGIDSRNGAVTDTTFATELAP
ncbi:MAG: prepilin-type N-terminal cleavage/methylation domain-containing protein [Gemmatimonadota bacterium]